MASKKSPIKNLLFIFGSGIIALGVVGAGVIAISNALSPSITALEPMINSANRGGKDDYEARFIAAKSMEPTFKVDDRILVDKRVYESSQPQRGDMIIFHPVEKLRQQNFKDPFIKRVVGLPGEIVEIKNGQVLINNQPIEEDYIVDQAEYTYKPTKIPDNYYFVLGDSRNNSYDSHLWGHLPENLIFGKVVSLYWPPSRAKQFE